MLDTRTKAHLLILVATVGCENSPLPGPDSGGNSGDTNPGGGTGGPQPATTDIILEGDSANGVPLTHITSVKCTPGANVAFNFPNTSRFVGLAVYLEAPYGGFEGWVSIEAAHGILYWQARTEQALPQSGSFILQAITVPSVNRFAPGAIVIRGAYACD